MTISESIGAWVRAHIMEDTLAIMMSGEVIRFTQEEVSTTDPISCRSILLSYRRWLR